MRLVLDEPRDAEVAELDELADRRALELDARAHEHHVVGLDVAMDDAEPVRLGERAAGVGDDAEREALGQLAQLPQRGRDAAARDQLEHEVVQPASSLRSMKFAMYGLPTFASTRPSLRNRRSSSASAAISGLAAA